jgi:hypothetical protein
MMMPHGHECYSQHSAAEHMELQTAENVTNKAGTHSTVFPRSIFISTVLCESQILTEGPLQVNHL